MITHKKLYIPVNVLFQLVIISLDLLTGNTRKLHLKLLEFHIKQKHKLNFITEKVSQYSFILHNKEN